MVSLVEDFIVKWLWRMRGGGQCLLKTVGTTATQCLYPT